MNDIRVVLDSNVFISAFLFGGHPQALIERIAGGQLSCVISVAILAIVAMSLCLPGEVLAQDAQTRALFEMPT